MRTLRLCHPASTTSTHPHPSWISTPPPTKTRLDRLYPQSRYSPEHRLQRPFDWPRIEDAFKGRYLCPDHHSSAERKEAQSLHVRAAGSQDDTGGAFPFGSRSVEEGNGPQIRLQQARKVDFSHRSHRKGFLSSSGQSRTTSSQLPLTLLPSSPTPPSSTPSPFPLPTPPSDPTSSFPSVNASLNSGVLT